MPSVWMPVIRSRHSHEYWNRLCCVLLEEGGFVGRMSVDVMRLEGFQGFNDRRQEPRQHANDPDTATFTIPHSKFKHHQS